MNKFELLEQYEAFYIGCILHDHTLMDEALLQPQHFLGMHNKPLYTAMLELKKDDKEVNPLTLSGLGFSRTMTWGGQNYISEIMAAVPSVNGFKSYEKSILDFHTVQEAQQYANGFIVNTTEKHDIKDLSNFIHDINKLESSTVANNQSFKQLLTERVEHHLDSPAKGLSGINTGYMNLNRFTDGWQRNDLIVIGARPSMGKTALVLNCLLNGCKKDNVFATLFSIEMAKGQIVDRLIAIEGKLNVMKMRNPNKSFVDEEWKRYHEAVARLDKLPIDIRDEYTTPNIRAAIRRNMKQHPDKKHIAAIDFLTLIKHTNPTGNMHIDITEIIWDLKQICKDFEVPIIVLAQLSRAVEQRGDKRPTMADIRESGSVEQVADLIAFLYRDDYYNKDSTRQGITEVIISKNRNGALGTVDMKFAKETNTFYDIA